MMGRKTSDVQTSTPVHFTDGGDDRPVNVPAPLNNESRLGVGTLPPQLHATTQPGQQVHYVRGDVAALVVTILTR